MTAPPCPICGELPRETESGRLEILHDRSKHNPTPQPEPAPYWRRADPDRPIYGGRNDE